MCYFIIYEIYKKLKYFKDRFSNKYFFFHFKQFDFFFFTFRKVSNTIIGCNIFTIQYHPNPTKFHFIDFVDNIHIFFNNFEFKRISSND